MLQQRIDERDGVLSEIAKIIELPDGLIIYSIPEKLKEFIDTRGDKAKIVSENKKLTKENQELTYELYKLKHQ